MKRIVCRFLLLAVAICLYSLGAEYLHAREMPKQLLGTTTQNSLTVVTIHEEDDPFFTLIWKDSPKGKEAAVDVYFYDGLGQRAPLAMNKWDNSGWLDSSLSLCADCGKRMVSVPVIGEVDIPEGATLFELVWHGADANGEAEDISTFGMIDPQLSWSIVDIRADPVPDISISSWGVDSWGQEQSSSISMVSIALLILTLMVMTVSAVGYGWWIGHSNE